MKIVSSLNKFNLPLFLWVASTVVFILVYVVVWVLNLLGITNMTPYSVAYIYYLLVFIYLVWAGVVYLIYGRKKTTTSSYMKDVNGSSTDDGWN